MNSSDHGENSDGEKLERGKSIKCIDTVIMQLSTEMVWIDQHLNWENQINL